MFGYVVFHSLWKSANAENRWSEVTREPSSRTSTTSYTQKVSVRVFTSLARGIVKFVAKRYSG